MDTLSAAPSAPRRWRPRPPRARESRADGVPSAPWGWSWPEASRCSSVARWRSLHAAHRRAGGAVTLRLLVAAIVLMAVCRPKMRGHSRADLGTVVIFGLTMAAMNGLFYQSVARIPLGPAVTLEVLGPLVLSVLTSRRALNLLWAGLALGGVFLLGGGGFSSSTRSASPSPCARARCGRRTSSSARVRADASPGGRARARHGGRGGGVPAAGDRRVRDPADRPDDRGPGRRGRRHVLRAARTPSNCSRCAACPPRPSPS